MSLPMALYVVLTASLCALAFKKENLLLFTLFLFSTFLYSKLLPTEVFGTIVSPIRALYISTMILGTVAHIRSWLKLSSAEEKKKYRNGLLVLMGLPLIFVILIPNIGAYIFKGRVSLFLLNEESRFFLLLFFFYPVIWKLTILPVFKGIQNYIYFALTFIAPSTLAFYSIMHLSFHRLRYGQLGILEEYPLIMGRLSDFLPNEGIFNINARASAFLLVAFCSCMPFIISSIHKAATPIKKLGLFALYAVFFYFICILNFLNIQLSIFLSIVVYLLFQLISLDHWKKIGETLALLMLFVGLVVIRNNLVPEAYRYKTIWGRLPDSRIQIVEHNGRFVPVNIAATPIGKTAQKVDIKITGGANRVQKMEMAFKNFIRTNPIVGHGPPLNQAERDKWGNEFFYISGHSKLVDEFAQYGLFFGMVKTAIFWLPLFFLLITKIRYPLLTFEPKTNLMMFFFLGSQMAAFFGNWGVSPVDNAIQMIVVWLMIYEIKKTGVWRRNPHPALSTPG